MSGWNTGICRMQIHFICVHARPLHEYISWMYGSTGEIFRHAFKSLCLNQIRTLGFGARLDVCRYSCYLGKCLMYLPCRYAYFLQACLTAQFHGWIFPRVRVRWNSSPITVPAKILPCETFQTRNDICGEKFREICWDVQRTRSKVLLVYYCIY